MLRDDCLASALSMLIEGFPISGYCQLVHYSCIAWIGFEKVTAGGAYTCVHNCFGNWGSSEDKTMMAELWFDALVFIAIAQSIV